MSNQPARKFQDLIVWQKSHNFVLSIYSISRSFPKEEIYGLTSQLRQAAVSVPANIAEGFKRITLPDKIRFLNIAQSSLEECRYYLILVKKLGYYSNCTQPMEDLEEVSKLLDSSLKKLEQRKKSSNS